MSSNSHRNLARALSLLSLILLVDQSYAQDHQHESPYTGLETREIKALSEADVQGLLNGEGMQMALPAELNGYPGPRHVLDMADELSLSDEQHADVQALFDSMHDEATRIGADIVEAERELDTQFASATIDPTSLKEAVSHIAMLCGQLRVAHLAAHLETIKLLTDFQRRHYDMLRGYGSHEH